MAIYLKLLIFLLESSPQQTSAPPCGALDRFRKYIHVGVEYLSTHANICEITHAHYYGKIYTHILVKTETQVAFMWE